MRVYTLFFTILFSLHSLAQDKVELKDGSFINGQVTSVRPTSVSVKTKFAGTIKILTKEIKVVDIQSQLYGELKDGRSLPVSVKLKDDNNWDIRTFEESGGQVLKIQDMMQIKDQIANRKYWNFELGIHIDGESGTDDEFNSALVFKAKYGKQQNRLTIDFKAEYERDDHERSANEYTGKILYEHDYTESDLLYMLSLFEHDEFEKLSLRWEQILGWGHFFFKEADTHLQSKLGLGSRYEKYFSEDGEWTPIGDFAIEYKNTLWEYVELKDTFYYRPDIDDFSKYKIENDLHIEMPFAYVDNMFLRFGLLHEYESNVPSDNEHLDTTYYTSLIYKW
ncbi:MAG: DUF481 domain-containing protein [Lentisphaeria bacterium]|nr:DUF481 domain-containing protein [Lentisphaeria bacterium]